MPIKGQPSQTRISHKLSNEGFVSVSPTDPINRGALHTQPIQLTKVDLLVKLAEDVLQVNFLGMKDPTLRIVKLTAHSIRKGDILRFTEGLNIGMEVSVEYVDTDHIYLSGILAVDASRTEFFHMRHITLTLNADGEITTQAGPIQFLKDAANQQVTEDTVVPANNEPLPVKLLDANGDTVVDNLKRLTVVDNIDGDIIDVSVSNIPGSAGGYLEIVASLAADIKELHVMEDIGEFIGLYSGAAASETFVCVLPQGYTGAMLRVQLVAGTRLSVRNMKATLLSTDTRLAITFLG